MAERLNRWRWRRVLILALFLLVPTLLADLPLFSKTGHKPQAPAAGQPVLSGGGAQLALLPVERGALHPGQGHRHWHTASGEQGDDEGGLGEAGLGEDGSLQNLVYLTHGEQ